MSVRGLVFALLALSFLVSGATDVASQSGVGRYQEFGDAQGFLNIIPPGQDGVLNGPEALAAQGGQYPPHVRDQLDMYGDLVYNTPGLSEDRLLEFFKDASFGVPENDIERVYHPCQLTTTCATADVVVVRDKSFGVPHIFGETRYATMFAMGYTGAEDRLFLMDVLRHVGRARLSEFLGASPGNQAMDREQLAIAPYKEQDLTHQLEAIRDSGPEGLAGYNDLLAYSDGVNQYITEAIADATKLPAEYPALQQFPALWKPEDTIAVASLVGGVFGKGGGGELTNLCGLKRLAGEVGSAAAARAIFDDLHFPNDIEAPTTSRTAAPYMENLGTVDPAAHPDVRCDSTLRPIDPDGPPLQQLLDAISDPSSLLPAFPGAMSNALLVSGDHTKSGHPIAIFGPQTGYFIPQLLVEKDVHGPGIDARGVAFAGTDLIIQLGRGRDFAWSATSASADNVDQWVLRLCEPGGGLATVDSMGYEHDGTCKPIETFQHTQAAKPSAGGLPPITPPESGAQCTNNVDDDSDGAVNDGCPPSGLPETEPDCTNASDDDNDGLVNDGCPPVTGPDIVLSWRVDRTEDYGPLVARGTLTDADSTPIAIASLRSTYRAELDSAFGFFRINNPNYMAGNAAEGRAPGFDSFRKAMGQGVDYTFNWLYVDSQNIGYQHSCKCPQRAQGVDPYLPTWGTGQWDWQGFIPLSAQPSELNPAEGWIISWNNKQAPQFKANDRNFGLGPVYRSLMLQSRLEDAIAAGKVDRANIVDIMEDAGTGDLRGQEDLPLLLQVLGPTAPPETDPRAVEMRNRLAAWVTTQTHRRDQDRSGEYDDPQAAAIMDAWWPRLARAMFDASSGHAINHLRLGLDDGDRISHLGSAFGGGGFYSHVNKDLRQVLGLAVQDPWSRTYCGGGSLASCRAALWASLEQAAADLEREFGVAESGLQCANAMDDDGDGSINEGCPSVPPSSETGTQCGNSDDDDIDGFVNDGCPNVVEPDVADWKRKMDYEDVRHRAVGVTTVAPIHWINRPTFQQLVQIGVPILGPAPSKVTGGGQIEGDPIFSLTGDLLSAPAIILSLDGTGKANFGFVVNNGATPKGNLEYRDPETGHRIKATSFNSLLVSSGTCGANTHARFTGTADVTTSTGTLTGQPLEVEVDDCGEPGNQPTGTDTFKITTTGYSNGPKPLIGGNIQIHK